MKPTAYHYEINDIKYVHLDKDFLVGKHAKVIPLYSIPTDKDGNPTHKLVPIEGSMAMTKAAVDKFTSMKQDSITYGDLCDILVASIEAALEIEDI